MSQRDTGGRQAWIWGTLAALSLIFGIAAARAEAPKVGDKVEIKFGDSWVEATVTWLEGDRVRARSAQGLESWFKPGEFRTPSKPETKPGDKAPAAAEAPLPEKTAAPLKAGDEVQVSFAGTWLPAKILKVEGQRVQAKLQSGMEKWFNQGEYKPPAGAAPLPGAKPPALPRPGETVEVSFAGTWLEAKVLKLEGQKVQAKLASGMETWFAPGDYRTLPKIESKFYGGLVAGSKVQAYDGHRWLPATIKKREAARFFVHYDDWSDAWDTWLNPDKIRPRAEAMGQFATGGVAAGAGETAAPEGVIQTAAGTVLLGDLSTATELSAEHAQGWALRPGPPLAAPAIGIGPFALGTKFNAGEKVQRIQFLGTDALIALVHDDPFAAPATRVVRVSMAAGHAPEVLTLPPGKRVVDFSPDGANVLCRQTVSDVPNCLEITPLSPGKPGREIVFKPHASKDREGDLLMAAFVDASHLLSCDSEGELVLYELPGERLATTQPTGGTLTKSGAATVPAAATRPKAIYRIKVNSTVKPVLMPGRKVIVAAANEKLRFFDALTGAPLGAAGDLNIGAAALAFNAAGSLMSVTTLQRMSIIELASGRIAREIPLPPDFVKRSSTATIWLPSGHLLLGKRYLVSPSQRLVIWSYLVPRGTLIESYAGSAWFVAGEGASPLSLSTVNIPHDQAKTATPPVKVDDLLVFRKGDQVTIEMATDAPADTRDKIQQSLEKQVKAMGLTLGGGTVRIIASTTSGETKSMDYRVVGRGVQTVSVTEKIHTMAVVLDGNEVWKVTNKAGASFMVSAKQGQSLEAAIQEQQDRSYSWLASVKIPTDMVRPEGYKVQGVARVTSAGAIEPATETDEDTTTTPADNDAVARPLRGAPRRAPK